MMNINRNRTSTRNSNLRNGRISKLTVHHAAGIINGDNLLSWGHNQSNQASWNYGIGSAAKVHQLVPDNRRAWTSSSASNDHQALTIEVGNSTTAPTWGVSNVVWEMLINLCVQLCRQNPDIKQQNGKSGLWFNNTPNASLTFHDMFSATTCPGPFIRARANQLCDEVNRRLGTNSITITTPPTSDKTYTVKSRTGGFFTANDARNNINRRNWVEPRTYHVFNESQGMINVTTTKGIPGSWINPNVNPVVSQTPKVGQMVVVLNHASRWATGETMPTWVRGRRYKIIQVRTRTQGVELLLEGIMSWILLKDVNTVS